jgi:RHS repeat-associated protein
MKRFLSALCVLVAAVFGSRASAQALDDAVEVPVVVQAGFTGYTAVWEEGSGGGYITNNPWIQYTLNAESTSLLQVTGSSSGTGRSTVKMKPGKVYTVVVSAAEQVYTFDFSINAPVGYRVVIEDMARKYIKYAEPGEVWWGMFPMTYRVLIESSSLSELGRTGVTLPVVAAEVQAPVGARLVPPNYRATLSDKPSRFPGGQAPAFLPAGISTELRPEKLVWSVGLGRLQNGSSAGVISLRHEGHIPSSFATPSALIFESDTTVVKRWPLAGALQQVDAPECIVKVETVSASAYRLVYYPRSGTETTLSGPGTRLVPNTAPWLEYEVQDPDVGAYAPLRKLRILRRELLEHALDPVGDTAGTTTIQNDRFASGVKTWWTQIEHVNAALATPEWKTIEWTTTPVETVGDRQTSWAYNTSAGTENILLKNASGLVDVNTLKTYQTYSWGPELKQTAHGHTLANASITQYDYHTDHTIGGYAKPKWIIEPTGGWARYDYSSTSLSYGELSRTFRPFRDAPATPSQATTTTGEVTDYTYGYTDWNGWRGLPTQILTKTNNVVTAKSVMGYIQNQTRNGHPVTIVTRDDYSDATNYTRTVTVSYREDVTAEDRLLPHLLHSAKNPDGTMMVVLYLKGSYNESTRTWTYGTGASDQDWEDIELHGTTLSTAVTLPDGSAATPLSYSAYSFNGVSMTGQRNATETDFRLVPGVSYATYTIRDRFGRERMSGKRIFVNNGTGNVWIDVDRVHSDYVKDALGRPAGPYLTRRLRDNGPGTPFTVESQLAWAGGLLVGERDRHGAYTRYTHTPGGRVATRVTETELAGTIAGDIREHYAYDAAGNLLSTRRQASTSPDNANDLVSSAAYDLAGRLLSSTTPGPLGPLTTTYSHFHGGNKLVTRVIKPNGADRISTSFLDGRPKTVTGTAVIPEAFTFSVATNGQLTTRRDLGAASSGIAWTSGVADWLGRTVIENRPTTTSTTVTLQQRSFFNNLGQLWKQQTFNSSGTTLLAPVLTTYDAMGTAVASGMDLNENGTLTAASTDRYSTSSSGFLFTDGHWWAASTSWNYHTDNSASARRTSKVLSRLTGCTCNLAETRSYDAYDQVTIVRRHVDRSLGEMREVTEYPDASATATTTHRYGFAVSSSSPSNVIAANVYDTYGRLVQTEGREDQVAQTTYFPGTSFPKAQRGPTPSAPAALQTYTELFYDGAGQLAQRRVKHGNGTASTWFAYNPRGQTLRQWGSAENPVEYAYDSYGRLTDQWTYRSSSAFETATWPTGQTGDRTQFAYHAATSLQTSRTDAASKVTSFLYDALNRISRRTLARGNYAVYSYRDATGARTGAPWKTQYYLSGGAVDPATPTVEHASARDGQPTSVIDGAGTRSFEYDPTTRQLTAEVLPAYFGTSRRLTYRYNGTLPGRLAGWRFHDTVDHLDNGYAYETATGRLGTISSTARVGGMVYGAHNFVYGYKPFTDLVASVAQGSFARDQTWKTWGDVADVWTSRLGPTGSATPIARFAYGYDDTARRTAEDLTGTLAASLGYSANGYRDAFTPDSRSQLVSIRRNNLDAAGTLTAAEVANQRRDWTYDAMGNRTLEARSGGSINYGVNNLNQYSSLTGLFTATVTHDFDGNRTSDATWNYTVDGENRLITMVKKDNTQRLEFAYDYLHRRVQKTVRSGPLATSPITSQLRFVHQGYQIIAEINATSPFAVVRSYTWGLDLSGTVGGGGGVGGLLQIHDATSRYQPLYNANGNVRGLITGDAFGTFPAGAIVAAYDYNVFGEAAATVGSAAIASANPIRFASKYLDVETGLYDHNHRFYDPAQGRFINRDPIGEAGGVNLYAYARNRPNQSWDWLGFASPQDNNDIVTLDEFTVWGDPVPSDFASIGDIPGYGAGSGGSGDSAPNSAAPNSAAPNSAADKDKKNDCYDFVDSLLSTAGQNNSRWWDESQTGAQIIDQYTPTGSDVRNTFGNYFYNIRPSIVDNLGDPTNPGELRPVSGFLPELVQGNQNAGVYFHVAANAGLYLQGFGSLGAYYQSNTDMNEFANGVHPLAQTLAEVAGNFRGVQVGKELQGFLQDKQSESATRDRLRSLLCK